MNAIQTLLTDHLDIWTDADTEKKSGRGRSSGNADRVYGIKKLRELILELAVRGKLVPQDPKDEPAKVLLEKIEKEKIELSAVGQFGKQQLLPNVDEVEIPFEIPANWEWVRLGDIGEIFNGNSINEKIKETKYTNFEGGLPFIATKDVGYGWQELDYKNGVSIPEEEQNFKVAHKGSVLICSEGGSAGKKCGITVKDICFGNKLYALEPYADIEPNFLLANYLTPTFFAQFRERMTGIIGGISIANFNQLLLPLPSVNEQRRIVAKVDELMALCDQLEQQQTHSIKAHQTLVEILLGTLTQIPVRGEPVEPHPSTSSGRTDFEENWQRIAAHFDTLFTTDASIDQLKQTILQLAVMGKLVPQDSNNESASVLLERIAKQKVRLVDAGEIRLQKSSSNIDEGERLFELPVGWKWCRLHEIVFLLGDGLHGTPVYTLNEKFYFVNGNNLNDGQIVIKPETKTVARDQYDKHRKPLGENSVLVSINGTLGNVAFYNNEAVILGKSACFFNLAEDIYKRFIKVVIDAPCFADYSYKNATGSTIRNLGLSAMNALPIALPPKEEQYRIVAKVEELMALCDALKARLADAQAIQLHLADAIVEQAVC